MTRLTRGILWLLLCVALTAPLTAGAQMLTLEASDQVGNGVLLPIVTRSATASSAQASAEGRKNMLLRFRLTTCAGSCNWLNYTVDVPDGLGGWLVYCTSAGPITSTGSYYMLVSGTVTDSADANIQTVCKKPVPPLFRVTANWTSGTSSSTSLFGYAWGN